MYVCVPTHVHVRPPALEPLCQLHPVDRCSAGPCHFPSQAGQQCPLLGSLCSSQYQGPQLAPSPQYTTRDCRTSWHRSVMPRGALSALREEHREKLRRAAEEAERQRQIQLAQKLEIMRQKKQVRRWRPAQL